MILYVFLRGCFDGSIIRGIAEKQSISSHQPNAILVPPKVVCFENMALLRSPDLRRTCFSQSATLENQCADAILRHTALGCSCHSKGWKQIHAGSVRRQMHFLPVIWSDPWPNRLDMRTCTMYPLVI